MQIDDACYQQTYKLRFSQGGVQGKRSPKQTSVEVTLPMIVIQKQARKRNMSVDEFVRKVTVIANFNGFEGVLYTFKEEL